MTAPRPHHWTLDLGHWSFLPLLLALLALTSCRPPELPATSAAPPVLRVSWTPSEDEPERLERWQDFARFLEQRLGQPVQLVQTGTYGVQIEAFRARKIEVGTLGPLTYVVAANRTPLTPLFVRGDPSGQAAVYRSLLVTPAGSTLQSLDDVLARTADLTIAWVDPTSTSGYLFPRSHLESLGLDPATAFSREIFTQNHPAAILAAKAARVDLAAVSSSTLDRLVADGRLAATDLRILWSSGPITTDVTAMRADLPLDYQNRLREAFFAFRTAEPAAWAAFAAGFPDPLSIWVPVDDAAFDPVRAVVRQSPHLANLE